MAFWQDLVIPTSRFFFLILLVVLFSFTCFPSLPNLRIFLTVIPSLISITTFGSSQQLVYRKFSTHSQGGRLTRGDEMTGTKGNAASVAEKTGHGNGWCALQVF